MNAHPLSHCLLVLWLLGAPATGGDLSSRSDLGVGDATGALPGTAARRPAPVIEGSAVSALQRGNDNQASILAIGHGHDIVLAQHGNSNRAAVAATGSNSRVAVGQNGHAHSVEIQVDGNNRMIQVQQSGNGRNDKVILH